MTKIPTMPTVAQLAEHTVNTAKDAGSRPAGRPFSEKTVMVIEFETKRASRYVLNGLLSFIGDPPSTDFETGYLSALLDVYKEGLNQGDNDDRINYLASFIRGENQLGSDEPTIEDVELVD